MPKNKLTEDALQSAAKMVRESMLTSLEQEEIVNHVFSNEFLAAIEKAREIEKMHLQQRRMYHRCVAAILSLVVGISLFFTINTQARAAAITWIKKVFPGQTVFSFLQDTDEATLDFQLTWLPDGMKLTADTWTKAAHSQLYQNPDRANEGFIIQCGRMVSQNDLTLIHSDAKYDIQSVEINGMPGELYVSDDSAVSNVLVWIDDSNKIVITIDSSLNPDVILHIAENVKLGRLPK